MTGSIARTLYRRFLSFYPKLFRQEFGEEMLGMIEECRAAQGFWRLLADVLVSAARQRICTASNSRQNTATPYVEIARAPRLAPRLALTVFGAALLPGVLVGGKPRATQSAMMVRPEIRFWFPTRMVVLDSKRSGGAAWRVVRAAASEQLKNWLAAYDGPDWDAYLSFVKKNFVTEPEPIFRNAGFRDTTEGFDLKEIKTETPVQATALVQERASDQMARIVIEVEAAEPYRIVKLHPEPIERPPQWALPHLNEKELIRQTRQRAEELVSADKFSGAILIAKNGHAVFAQAYGLADREHHIPNSLDTRFRAGSINKMFTAVATLQLVKAGKLKLDEPIGTYLTDYPNKEIASKVTIRELLSHTGGTGNYYGPEYNQHRLELRTHEDYVRMLGSRPPRFEPGSRWEYSNYGFIILGAIIDHVSGQNYFDYVREHIYAPAGMTSSGAEPEDQPVPNRAVGYTKRANAWHINTDVLPYRGMAAGGGYTTVGDLLRFANAFESNKLLDAQDTALATTGTELAPNRRYGLGFEVHTMNGVRCFGHTGEMLGENGDLEICPAAGYVVAVLANLDPPAATRISTFVANRLPEPGAARAAAHLGDRSRR